MNRPMPVPAPIAPAPKLLSLAAKTRREAPIRMLVHGQGGCGKSTFGAAAPSPVFIAAEDGLANIDAVALPEPRTWTDLLAQLDALRTEQHTYKTLVIDSLDWAEPLVWDHVCKKASKPDIEAFGYGKGYIAALSEWRILLNRASSLRDLGMNIIFIAHSVRKSVKNPEGDDYESWVVKLHEKASGLIKEWVDVVGFAAHDIATTEVNGRVKGLSTGERVLKVQPHPAYDAKTRLHLPVSVPLDWAAFTAAVSDGRVQADGLKKEIEALVAELGDAVVGKKVAAAVVEANGSAVRLAEVASRLRVLIKEKTK